VHRIERLFVWLGGARFITSLAVAAWYDIVVFGRAHPFAGWWPAAGNLLLFSIFALHHSVFARDEVKSILARAIRERLLRSVYVWTASILMILVCVLWRPVGGTLYSLAGIAAVLCWIIQLAGLVLIAQSVRAIDPLELAGIKSPGPRNGLQADGVYHLVRHPLYLGWILVVLGSATMTGDRLAFAVITSLYLIVGIRWEERSLRMAFGSEYEAYSAAVRWKVIPYVF